MDLRGKNILITGAARRLGAFLAVELSKMGANLFIHYNSSEEDALKLKKICEKNKSKVELIKADFSLSVSELIRVIPYIDILICNASSFKKIEPDKITEDDIIRSIKVEFLSHFMLIKELWIESKRQDKFSKVVAFSDAVSVRRDFLPYHIGKNLIEFVTEEFSKFFAPYLTMNCIAIGVALPPEDKDEKYIESLIDKIPMKRAGKLNEIFSAVKFLIENDYITGQVIKVSGGM